MNLKVGLFISFIGLHENTKSIMPNILRKQLISTGNLS